MSLLPGKSNTSPSDKAGQSNANATTTKEPSGSAAATTRSSVNQTKNNDDGEEKTFEYSTPHSDGFTFHFADGTVVKTENGVMKLNPAQHKEIQTLIHKHRRYDIAQQMILLDREAAERTAREFLAKMEAKKQGHAGTSSTATAQALAKQVGNEPVRNLDQVEEHDISLSHGGESVTGGTTGQNGQN